MLEQRHLDHAGPKPKRPLANAARVLRDPAGLVDRRTAAGAVSLLARHQWPVRQSAGLRQSYGLGHGRALARHRQGRP